MTHGTICDYLETARSAAKAAGCFLRTSERSIVVENARRDIRLDSDSKSEQIIFTHLGSDFSILSEEHGWVGGEATCYWVVDGLDGTVNYHHSIPLTAVSIGLVINREPVLGVVYDFFHNEMFSGCVGHGVTLNGKSVCVSQIDSVESALLLTALATKRVFDESVLESFGRKLGRWKKVRMLGSASLSLAYVASGRADACEIEGIMDWDVAAGVALVRAAGGVVLCNSIDNHVNDVHANNGCFKF